ncbi:hypothetical protein [Anaerococcus porci]|uniref:hypothetical protein n=1 Tax=Anaerococcus porci TaxID=2652269 RepID=UPI0018A6C621|nr:hypothetical protein [Anaerococcus porci]
MLQLELGLLQGNLNIIAIKTIRQTAKNLSKKGKYKERRLRKILPIKKHRRR